MLDTIQKAVNRGNNLLITVFLTVLSTGVIAELFLENELLDKLDDAALIVVGILGIIWYLRGQNRYRFSWVPYGLIVLDFAVKVAALINEFSDPAAAGDEYGIVVTLAVMLVVSGVILLRTRRGMPALTTDAMVPTAIPQTGEQKGAD